MTLQTIADHMREAGRRYAEARTPDSPLEALWDGAFLAGWDAAVQHLEQLGHVEVSTSGHVWRLHRLDIDGEPYELRSL